MSQQFSSTDALIQATRNNEDTRVFEALLALQRDITALRRLLNTSEDQLNRRTAPTQLEQLIRPRSSNPPPLAGTKEGLTFYNTSRGRFQKSTDTWPYYDYPTPESCKLSRTTNQTIANNTVTTVEFDTVDFDHYNMVDLAASTTRITFPISGRYFVGACVRFDDNATGFRAAIIRRNGGANISVDSQPAIADAGVQTTWTISTIFEFDASDYVELRVQQTSGGNLDLEFVNNFSIKFYAHRLG